MPARDVLLAVLVTVIWGINFVVIDEGLDGMPPLVLVALRFVVVALPAVFLIPRPVVPGARCVASAAFLSFGQFGLLYTSLAVGMPAGLASLVLQAQVIFTVLIAAGGCASAPPAARWPASSSGRAASPSSRSAGRPRRRSSACCSAWPPRSPGPPATSSPAGPVSRPASRWSSGPPVFVPVPMFALALAVDGPAEVGRSLAHLTLLNVVATSTRRTWRRWSATACGTACWRGTRPSVVPFALLVPPVGMASAWLVQHERPGAAEIAGGLVLLAGVAVTGVRRHGA